LNLVASEHVLRRCQGRDVTNFNFEDDIFEEHLNDGDHDNHETIIRFLSLLALCHTVIVGVKKQKKVYNASSPDELALVNAAKYFGVRFEGRDDQNNIEINLFSKPLKYELLNVLEFTSDR